MGWLRRDRMSRTSAAHAAFRLRAGRHADSTSIIEYSTNGQAPLRVPLRPLGEPTAESWFLQEASQSSAGSFQLAGRGDHLLLSASFDAVSSLEETTSVAYRELLELVASRGLQLNRIWNYVRDINEDQEGLERYRRFSVGRFEAFRDAGFRLSDDLPAASAVGSHAGPDLTIVAIAGPAAGRQIENPRQVSAYDYPESYGPRSPSFSRATLVDSRWGSMLWISGTASIVGHETVHQGDAAGQLDETLRNLRAVLGAAGFEADLRALTMLKVYVRNPDDFPMLRERLSSELSSEAGVIWLEADICRRDLLLEIEALAEVGAGK